MSDVSLSLREHVAAHLERVADELTDRWLTELRKRLRVREIRLLPTEALRDHMPIVIRALADALRLFEHEPADELRSHLRLVSELRREQSYPVVELLREFNILGELIFAEILELLDEDEGWEAVEVGRLFAQLNRSLTGVGMVAVETYQEAFLLEKEHLADRLSELATTLEHELRAPLQAASAGVELLREESVIQDPDRREHYIGMVEQRLQRLSHLVGDIHELAVAERALTREQRKPIREVIETVFDELESMAEERDVQLDVNEPLEEITVDPARVEVALMNLVSNAIKYSDPEKPRRWVRLSLQTVDSDEAPRWQLRVEDNGLGLPNSLRHQAFQRGVRLHPERAQGTGLGLAIVKEIMEQRGGSVAVETEEGEGSTFILELTPRLAGPEQTQSREGRSRDRGGADDED